MMESILFILASQAGHGKQCCHDENDLENVDVQLFSIHKRYKARIDSPDEKFHLSGWKSLLTT